jgi:hypothetical protein
VPTKLIHNLRKQGIPGKYVDFVRGMLSDRSTALKFNGYTLDPIKIDNGIGQGDPLSMVMYLSWMQSMTSSSPSSKLKVPQVNPVIRPSRDPEKQGTHAKPSGDLVSHNQTRNKSPDTSCVLTRDKSQDQIRFGRARSPLINKWQTVGTVCNQ